MKSELDRGEPRRAGVDTGAHVCHGRPGSRRPWNPTGSGRKIGLSIQSPGNNGQVTWQLPGGKDGSEPAFLPTRPTRKRGLVTFNPESMAYQCYISCIENGHFLVQASLAYSLTLRVIVTSVRKGEDKDSFKL